MITGIILSLTVIGIVVGIPVLILGIIMIISIFFLKELIVDVCELAVTI